MALSASLNQAGLPTVVGVVNIGALLEQVAGDLLVICNVRDVDYIH